MIRAADASADEPPRVPAGAPKWVTPELIAMTLAVWQPYYAAPLAEQDALDIILGVSRLFDVLAGKPADEQAVRGVGPGQQS